MAITISHSTPADGTFSAAGATAWNAGHSVSGATQYGVYYAATTTSIDQAAGFTFGGAAAGTGLAIAAGTATTDVNALNATGTWNSGGTTFTLAKLVATTTASAAASKILDLWAGTSGAEASVFAVNKAGKIVSPDFQFSSGTGSFGFATSSAFGAYNYIFRTSGGGQTGFLAKKGLGIGWADSSTDANNLFESCMSSGGSNQVVYNVGTTIGSGTVTSRAECNKLVTAIANNTATATFTVTIPNGAHSAGGKFILKGAAGAGGAIGADEFSAGIEYDWIVTRTLNLGAVATLSTAVITAITASVAGAATPTISAALSAIAGATNATNTFTLNVTINALTGSSTNHTCFCYGSVLNDNASGVTIA